MNDEELFASELDDRFFSRLNRGATKHEEYDLESETISRRPFSPDYFTSIWEGRS